ncbi:MAG: hypothetical protein ABSF60_01335 [Verrucomicrobiota bacterium]|jgi:hypothetical protein
MKYRRTLILIALFAASTAAAWQPFATSSASRTAIAGKPAIHWFKPGSRAELNGELKFGKGPSPRAWTTIAGWHPGVSAFPDANAENYSCQLQVLSVGHESWP